MAPLYECVYPLCDGKNDGHPGCVTFFSVDNTKLNIDGPSENVALVDTPVAVCLAVKSAVFEMKVDKGTLKHEWQYFKDPICTDYTRDEFIVKVSVFMENGTLGVGRAMLALAFILLIIFILAVYLVCTKKKNFGFDAVA